jgi:transcription antitermination protein NusB
VTEGRQSRRSQRRSAAFLLYQKDLTGAGFDELYEAYERDNGEAASEFTRRAVERTWEERESLDARIDGAARGWTASRMAVLERNILRLATWEMTSASVPAAIAIDEAVALAKRYASPEAAGLVNGVLGAIARREGVGR